MKDPENISGVLDGEDAFPDFLDPKWQEKTRKEIEAYEKQRKREGSEKRPKVETAKGQ